MNVYDFDKTVFYPDSSACFYRFCLLRFPGKLLPTLPRSAHMALCYWRKKLPAKVLKEQLFSFLSEIESPEELVDAFWRRNERRLESWYLNQKRDDDVIISASPVFLLAPICRKLGVTLIATEMDAHTGKIRGANCHDAEKPLRFRALFPDATIDAFYSDSLSDSPMAKIAERAYLVKKHTPAAWPL